MKKRAAVLLDNLNISKWQFAALEAARESVEIVLVLNCQNTKTKKNYSKHFLYYVLNILSLRNHLTRKEEVSFPGAEIINFSSIYKGAWQNFPSSIYEDLVTKRIDLVIKFGMSLLRLDERKTIPPILSYHHGDPSKYRGRPAGFYEILNGDKLSGIIVQRLTNKLDAGVIYAFAESKVVNYSYKKTALNFYSNSAPLLNKAVFNLSNNIEVQRSVNGRNYRLPSNIRVMQFALVTLMNAIRKLLYGLFFEKRWKVAVTTNSLSLQNNNVLTSSDFTVLPITENYNFYADPFYSHDGSQIRLEALDKKAGLGDILEIEISDFFKQKVLCSGAHYSYPYSFSYKGTEYLLPEVASHSAQYFSSANDKFEQKYYLRGLEDKRIVDATLLLKDDYCYLFFGEAKTAHTLLHLWVSDGPFGIFNPHPTSPIAVSPSDARMGGKVLNNAGEFLRFGQNNAGEYGESLTIMRITNLSHEFYEELKIGSITIDNFMGPHSIGFNSDMSQILIDYYNNEFSVLAGVRRIKAKLGKT
ncbi:hypothetical protein N9W97_03000 [Pseudomonadales bacterium]|nr:hypothetical protein [Pseudomonadales bacterium]